MRSNPLATALREAKSIGNNCGRVLHDRVGPLLTAAGIRLQLLRMDHASIGEDVGEVLSLLDQAIEEIRSASNTLSPSLVYRIGLEAALRKMVEDRQASFPGTLRLNFSATAKLDPELGTVLFDAVEEELNHALLASGVTNIVLTVTGAKQVAVRIECNSKTRRSKRGLNVQVAEAAGFFFGRTNTVSAKGAARTFVQIRY